MRSTRLQRVPVAIPRLYVTSTHTATVRSIGVRVRVECRETMASRDFGKAKPLKAPKKDKKEEDEDDLALKAKLKAEAKAKADMVANLKKGKK